MAAHRAPTAVPPPRSAKCSDCSKQRFQGVCALKCKQSKGFAPVCAKVTEKGETRHRVFTNRCVLDCANEVSGGGGVAGGRLRDTCSSSSSLTHFAPPPLPL